MLLIMYRSLLITARLLLITGLHKSYRLCKFAQVTPVSITVLIIHSLLHLGQVPLKALSTTRIDLPCILTYGRLEKDMSCF